MTKRTRVLPPFEERRHFPRYQIHDGKKPHLAAHLLDAEWWPADVLDLSKGGVSLFRDHHLNPGEVVTLSLHHIPREFVCELPVRLVLAAECLGDICWGQRSPASSPTRKRDCYKPVAGSSCLNSPGIDELAVWTRAGSAPGGHDGRQGLSCCPSIRPAGVSMARGNQFLFTSRPLRQRERGVSMLWEKEHQDDHQRHTLGR
jgi:hypothetical protein